MNATDARHKRRVEHLRALDRIDKFNNDVFKLARRKGVRHGRIYSDAVLSARSFARWIKG